MVAIIASTHDKFYRDVYYTPDKPEGWKEDVSGEDEVPFANPAQQAVIDKINGGEFHLHIAEDGTVSFKLSAGDEP